MVSEYMWHIFNDEEITLHYTPTQSECYLSITGGTVTVDTNVHLSFNKTEVKTLISSLQQVLDRMES
jgi:hypothetical protein